MRYDFGEDMYVGLVSSCSNTLPTKKYECIPCNYSSDTDSPGVLGGWRKECVREKERRERGKCFFCAANPVCRGNTTADVAQLDPQASDKERIDEVF